MSGGYFEYKNYDLQRFIDQLKHDIELNDVKASDNYEYSTEPEKYGFQHCPETIEYIQRMIVQLRELGDLLHAYDYYVSGDTAEEDFLKTARAIYGKAKPSF